MPGASTAAAAVVDASVAVKWVVKRAAQRGRGRVAPQADPLARPASHARRGLRRKTAGGQLRPGAAATSLAALLDAVRQGVIRLADDEDLVASALLLALDLGHKLPDCLYLTLAEREGCLLSTGDRPLARLAQSRNVGVLGVGAAAR